MIGQFGLFTYGLKTAYLATDREPGYVELTSFYPWIDLSYFHPQEREIGYQRLFFQNEKQKQRFLRKGMKKPSGFLPYNEGVLGTFLGFPPAAVKDYKKGLKEHNRVDVNYHGLKFVCHRKHVESCLDYLHKHMPIPENLIQEYRSSIEITDRNRKDFKTTTLPDSWKKIVE